MRSLEAAACCERLDGTTYDLERILAEPLAVAEAAGRSVRRLPVSPFRRGFCHGFMWGHAIGVPALILWLLLLAGCSGEVQFKSEPANKPFSDVTVKLDKGQFDHLMGTTPETPAVIHSEPTPAEPLISIVGPTERAVGEMVVLTAKGESKGWSWTCAGKHAFETADGGQRLFFCTPKPGEYEFILAGYPPEAVKPEQVSHFVTILGVQPEPPVPQPDPGPKPPGPVPPPQPGAIRVLIIEETSERTPAIANIIQSQRLYAYLNTHCSKTGTHPDWRIFDQDADISKQAQHWRDAMNMPRTGLPWIVICNGTNCHSGPLPKTVDELLSLLAKWGGP